MQKISLLGCLLILLASCGHTTISSVGLMSFGDLEGKQIPDLAGGEILQGKSCGYSSYISDAVRDALKNTEDDTLLYVKVTSETGLFVASNCLTVDGVGLNSKELPKKETIQ